MTLIFERQNKVISRLICLSIFVLCVFSLNESSAAESPNDYTSIYSLGWDASYYDASGNIKTEILYSFKDLYNLYDSKILCKNESGPCPMPSTTKLSLKDSNFSFDRFRIYIPPGTYSLESLFYFMASDEVGLAVRYGSPPEGDYSNLRYSEVDWDWESEINSLDDYTGSDVLLQNSGGHITILNSSLNVVTEGGWLYFKLLKFKGNERIYGIKHLNSVYTSDYNQWYNATEWINGDPPIVYTPPTPKQVVSLSVSPATPVIPDTENFKITVEYDVTDGNNNLDGLGIGIHFDSTKVDYTGYGYLFEAGSSMVPTEVEDVSNSDGDDDTDMMVKMQWTDNNNWPNRSLYLDLVDLNFKLLDYSTKINTSVFYNDPDYGVNMDAGALMFYDPTVTTTTTTPVVSTTDTHDPTVTTTTPPPVTNTTYTKVNPPVNTTTRPSNPFEDFFNIGGGSTTTTSSTTSTTTLAFENNTTTTSSSTTTTSSDDLDHKLDRPRPQAQSRPRPQAQSRPRLQPQSRPRHHQPRPR